MGEGLRALREGSSLPDVDMRTYSSLSLAYLGDAVFELMVREALVAKGNVPVKELHKKATSYVNAGAQAALAKKIAPLLTEEEEAVLRRGRNAHPPTVAKHASISDYRHATGFEALVGYLYLSGQVERLLSLLQEAIGEVQSGE